MLTVGDSARVERVRLLVYVTEVTLLFYQMTARHVSTLLSTSLCQTAFVTIIEPFFLTYFLLVSQFCSFFACYFVQRVTLATGHSARVERVRFLVYVTEVSVLFSR
jgi:hypothetical protein